VGGLGGEIAMIARLIDWSAEPDAGLDRYGFRRRSGRLCPANTRHSTHPRLSDTQVIVYTDYKGQAPQVIETKSPIR